MAHLQLDNVMDTVATIPYSITRFKPHIGRAKLVKRKSLELSCKMNIQQKLTLLCAPAGFGKTVLMSQWYEASIGDGAHCVWLNFETSDRHCPALLDVLAASLGGLNIKLARSKDQALPLEESIALMVNALAIVDGPVIWFMDAYERVFGDDSVQVINRLLACLPDTVKLVISSRVSPQWSQVELFLQDDIRLLTRSDLRFSLTEIKKYFEIDGGGALNENQVYKLASCMEGWPAAIKLAAVAMRSASSPGDIKKILNGEVSILCQFIEHNILSDLDDALLEFIYKTAHLNSLRVELCNSLCNITDSDRKIADLMVWGLVTESKHYRHIYHYPGYISVYLKNNFLVHAQANENRLHEKAVDWFIDNNIASEAFYHALFLADISWAMKVLKRFARQLVVSGEISLLTRFFDRLPAGEMDKSPLLYYVYVWTQIITQKFTQASVTVKALKDCMARFADNEIKEEFFPSVSEIKVFEYRIRQALDSEWADPSVWIKLKNSQGDSDTFLSEQIELSLGSAYLRKERLDDAYTAFMEAVRFAEINETPITALTALAKMAYIRKSEGRLLEAMDICDDAIDLSIQKYGSAIPVVAVPLLVKSEIHYELSHMNLSEEHHLEATRLFEKYNSVTFNVQAIIHGAKLANYYHGADSAITLLAKAKNIVSGRSDHHLNQRVCAEQIKYHLHNAEITMVESILRHENISIDRRNPSPSFYCSSRDEAIYASFCRYLMAVGRYDAASAWLTKMLHQAQAHGRNRFCLEVAGLLALTHAAIGDESRAMRSVREMLLFGERANAIQSILDLGPKMVPLIDKYQRQQKKIAQPDKSQYGPSDSYVESLLAHSRGELYSKGHGRTELAKRSPASVKTLAVASSKASPVDLLTPRELDVLVLICDGCSNKNIARELILGEGTVKWHVKNIFAKLNVASRTQAAAVGRAMGVVS